jgi:hypothetical protein
MHSGSMPQEILSAERFYAANPDSVIGVDSTCTTIIARSVPTLSCSRLTYSKSELPSR